MNLAVSDHVLKIFVIWPNLKNCLHNETMPEPKRKQRKLNPSLQSVGFVEKLNREECLDTDEKVQLLLEHLSQYKSNPSQNITYPQWIKSEKTKNLLDALSIHPDGRYSFPLDYSLADKLFELFEKYQKSDDRYYEEAVTLLDEFKKVASNATMKGILDMMSSIGKMEQVVKNNAGKSFITGAFHALITTVFELSGVSSISYDG